LSGSRANRRAGLDDQPTSKQLVYGIASMPAELVGVWGNRQ
jgi:hypothetical protein